MNNLKLQKQTWFIIAVCAIFLLTCLTIQATNSTKKEEAAKKKGKGNLTIEYDYLDLDNPLTDGYNGKYVVWHRNNVTFKIKNVNPFLFKVKINRDLKDYFIESPQIFQETAKKAMEMKKDQSEETKKIALIEGAIQMATEKLTKKDLENNRSNKVQIDKATEDLNTKKTKMDDQSKIQVKAEKKALQSAQEAKEAELAKIEAEKAFQEAEVTKNDAETKFNNAAEGEEKVQAESALSNARGQLETVKNAFDKSKENAEKALENAITDKTAAEIQKQLTIQFAMDVAAAQAQLDQLTQNNADKKRKLNAILEFVDVYKKMETILDFYNQLVDIVFKNEKFSIIDCKKNDLIQRSKDREKTELITGNLCPTFIQWTDKASDCYNNIDFFWLSEKDASGNMPLLSTDQIDQLKKYGKNIDGIKELNIIGKIKNILANLTEENFTRSLTVPNVESDEVRFSVEMERIPNDIVVDYPQQILDPVVVRVKCGWVMNFSTGPIFQLNAHNKSYRLDPSENDSTKVVIRENEIKKSITPGIAAFMHVYPRSARSIRWGGITFGLGVRNEDINILSYYLGSSVMFGFMKRLVVTGGVSLVQINTLKPEYHIEQEVDKTENLKPENMVYKDYKLSFFLGFTFNLNN